MIMVLSYSISWFVGGNVPYLDGLLEGLMFTFPASILLALVVAILGPKVLQERKRAIRMRQERGGK